MLPVVVIVCLGAAILLSHQLAPRLHVALPIVLFASGVVLGFLPGVGGVHLPSEAVLVLFLPALLYWESLTTSLREIRHNLRGILSLGTGLVVFTAALVAVVAHAVGMGWGPAWVLGAAIAPTDATAVSALASGMPRRMQTMLRAESLVNDGTTLVVYGVAVGVVTGEESLGALHIAWLTVLSYGGGVLAGLLTGWLIGLLRRHLEDPLSENIATLLTPFIAFLAAESVEASGVLAVVVCGLMMSQSGPRIGTAQTRQMTNGFWSLSTEVLNGALFVLVGIQVHSAVHGLSSVDLRRAIIIVVLAASAAVAARFLWLFTTPYVLRAMDRRPEQRAQRMAARPRVVMATAGFRGAVSLAMALAVPTTVDSGGAFPERDLIVFATAGVIVVSLVQAFVLPHAIAWANLPKDEAVARERRLAQNLSIQETLDHLDEMAAKQGASEPVVERVRRELRAWLAAANESDAEDTDALSAQDFADYQRLAAGSVRRARERVFDLRDEGRIDDEVMRRLMAQLDLEELRLSEAGLRG